jgi:hypothetical protein
LISTCSTNSTVELLHGGVRGAELKKREQSSPKHALRATSSDSGSTPIVVELLVAIPGGQPLWWCGRVRWQHSARSTRPPIIFLDPPLDKRVESG